MWGTSILDPRGRMGVDVTGHLGSFYRGCLRALLDVGREVRNAVLYVLCAKPPLHVFCAKQALLFARSLSSHPRLVSEVVQGAVGFEGGRGHRVLTCHRLLEVAGLFEHNSRVLYR